MRKQKRMIIWNNQQEEQARRIVEAFAEDMERRDIAPYTATRPGGVPEISLTGVLRYAMLRLDEQAREKAKAR